MNYKIVKYSEIGKIRSGKRLPKGYTVSEKISDNKYIRVRDINSGSIDSSIVQYITDEAAEKLERYKVKTKDVIISVVGTVGAIAQIDESLNGAYLTENCDNLQVDESLCLKDYLKYYLLSEDGSKEIITNTVGSTQPKLPIYGIENFNIKLPSIDNQKRIVNLLNSIDKKIKLNNEINNNLYEMLKSIYRKLYLNNSSYNNWKSMTLDDVTSKFATGLNPRKNFVLGQGNNYYVTIKNMPNNQVVLDGKCDRIDDKALVKINKRSDLKVGDLLFSGIGTIGRTYLIKNKPTNWNISESVFTIRPNNKISSEFLYLLLLDSDMQNYAVSKASGSVQKGIRMADLKLYKLNVPEKEWMEAFTNTVRPLIDKIYLNYEMNDKLCKLRDTLLPKLMNGEIDLDNIEI